MLSGGKAGLGTIASDYLFTIEDSRYLVYEGIRGTLYDSDTNFVDLMDRIKADDISVEIKSGDYEITKDLDFEELDYFSLKCLSKVKFTLANNAVIDILGCRFSELLFDEIYTPEAHTNPALIVQDATVSMQVCEVGWNRIYAYGIWTLDPKIGIGVHVYSEDLTGVSGVNFHVGSIRGFEHGIVVEQVGNATDGYVNANTFKFKRGFINTCLNCLTWIVEDHNRAKSNIFDGLALHYDDWAEGAGETARAVKDLSGRDNMYLNCRAWDFDAEDVPVNIVSGAIRNFLIGGNLSGRGFDDQSGTTIIIDLYNVAIPDLSGTETFFGMSRFVGANEKIGDGVTQADTNKHTLDISAFVPVDCVAISVLAKRTGGADSIYLYSNEGTTYFRGSSEYHTFLVAIGNQRLQYSLETANDVFDIFMLGYITEDQ